MTSTKINRTEALKNFVEALQEKYPDTVSYDRAMLEDIASTNPHGLTMFASEKQGNGRLTRLSRGSYIVPKAWLTGEAPWDPTPSTEESVQKSEPKKVSKKKAAASTTSEEN